MKKIESEIRTYLKERDWNHLRPSDLAKSISIEAAELLELFQWTEKTIEEVKNDKELLSELKKELADVLIYAIDMTVLLEIDTEKIILDKLESVKEKYPAEIIKESQKVENSNEVDESLYLKIKKEHREKRK
jgi:NTP pyrophosphatase (non-canonical NTP hydrolase)